MELLPENQGHYESSRLQKIQEFKMDLLQQLSEHQIELDTNRLDQHFTVDPVLISELTEGVGPENTVLEIGSGSGAITEALAREGAGVFAIEMDTRLEPLLREKLAVYQNVELIVGNALEFEIPEDVDMFIGNPPFSIFEPLFKKILNSNIEKINIIVGQNTLRSIESPVSSDDFTILSLFAQSAFRVANKEVLDNASFYPRPKGTFYRVNLEKRGLSEEVDDYASAQTERILSQFSNYMIENPNYSLGVVLRFILENNRVFNKQAKKYKDYGQLFTVEALDIQKELLKKSLGSLNNHEVRKVLQTLIGKINKKIKADVIADSQANLEEDERKITQLGLQKSIQEMADWSGGEYRLLESDFEEALKEEDQEKIKAVARRALEIVIKELNDKENLHSFDEINRWLVQIKGYLHEE